MRLRATLLLVSLLASTGTALAETAADRLANELATSRTGTRRQADGLTGVNRFAEIEVSHTTASGVKTSWFYRPAWGKAAHERTLIEYPKTERGQVMKLFKDGRVRWFATRRTGDALVGHAREQPRDADGRLGRPGPWRPTWRRDATGIHPIRSRR